MLDEVPARVDTFEQAQTVALVEESLGQLNERYRTALVLKDLHGLPPEEIADVMEVSRSNADVLVHRARAAFKTVFAKLAGDVPAPASLGLVLAPLSVPAGAPRYAAAAAPRDGRAARGVAPTWCRIPALRFMPRTAPACSPSSVPRSARRRRSRPPPRRSSSAAPWWHGRGARRAAGARPPLVGFVRHRLAAALREVEQAVVPLEPLLELDAARLADGLELGPLELEQPQRRLVVADEQRHLLVERRFADGGQRQLERGQLDDVDKQLVWLGLVFCQELVELVGVE